MSRPSAGAPLSMSRLMHALLVEDSVIFAEALRDLLTEARSDIRLSHVTSLAEAKRFRDAHPDVVLLDLSLPDADGMDSVRGAFATLPGVPIVVLTAERDSERALEVVRGGAQDYLIKGAFDADTLMRAIRYAVERAESGELRHRLLRADRLAAVGRLAAGIAHEVSNPAAFVRANHDLLRASLESAGQALEIAERLSTQLMAAPPTLKEALSRVGRELGQVRRLSDDAATGVERIGSVVADLRAYTRLEPGDIGQIQVNEVIHDVCRLASGLVRHKASLVKDLGEVSAVNLVPGRLDQVLMNLLVNAVHAIREGAPERERIVVSSRQRGDRVLIAVEDTGIGMTDEEQRRAFEPFFSTKRHGEGMGLGLSVCADIVGAHGGMIRCSSTSNQGSRFEVWLPAAPPAARAPASLTTPPPVRPPSARRPRILLVDDEPHIRQTYSLLLEGEFDVMTAGSGTETLACLEADPGIDLVICDIMMPDMDAASVLEEVRRRRPELISRFVLHTGGAMNERTRRVVDSGEFPVFFKPISAAEIASAIRKLMRSSTPPGPTH